MRYSIGLILAGLLLVAGCQVVPSTGDKSTDPSAAQNFVPAALPGYTASDATDIADALGKAGTSITVFSGNVAAAALIAKLDNMMQCYKGVGAVAAKVFTESPIPLTGSIPKIGVLAVINSTRIQSNFLQCAINIVSGPSAQAVGPEPCGSSGEFTVNNEKLDYIYGATSPDLCKLFQQGFNGRT